ncbi:hypothetical protein R3X28_01790 [Maribacter sp. TH_r10]|uniref:hypothetical protein n=1 Tax=Maribacter sp. TH_r10 TaxID=3082086 RepID=UPI002953A8D9|nr:hypothetical protein [Maribacter sp. TH_r10]MDV7137585.1 hypothetical protein [Maribacter sp. TH_r10]
MKKLLFIESRYVTYLYDKISESLISHGFEIHWIVLNHQFIPKTGNITLLEYPKKSRVKEHKNGYLDSVIATDRHLRFFGKKEKNHFYHFDKEIRKAIEFIRPDFVFGEPTSFHHLISLEVCKEFNILYLHPASCRYPVSRFAFYLYDSLVPYKGSKEVLSEKEAHNSISAIVNRTSIPNYMVPPKISLKESITDKIKVLSGFIEGERYNTPSPINKLLKDTENRQILKVWNNISTNQIDSEKFAIVFPLHMQPESSIDVWGRKFSNQNDVIKEISKRLKKNEVLYVKPNPKSSFEINKELIKIISEKENVEALHSNVKMSEIFDTVDLFINVVGTIAIECILSSKPVISLIKTYFNDTRQSFSIESYDDIVGIIELIKKGRFTGLSKEEKILYFNNLNSLSYDGVIGDTYNNKNVINENNIKKLHNAFIDILKE